MVKSVPTAITYIQSKRNGLPALEDDVTGRTHVDKLDNGSTGKIRLILKNKIKVTTTSFIIQLRS